MEEAVDELHDAGDQVVAHALGLAGDGLREHRVDVYAHKRGAVVIDGLTVDRRGLGEGIVHR
eukprot:16268998-Heterocapsa_arctica.AAC.1